VSSLSNQITVAVYVDDLLVTCKEVGQIRKFKEALIRQYKEVTYDEGDKLSYLGMIVDNTKKDYVEISMPKYIET